MKRLPRILFLCILVFALTACQPIASDPSGTPEESSAQREETSATDPQEESSSVEETDMAETSGEETPSEETEPVEEPTGYVEVGNLTDDRKREVLSIPVGSEDGQVAYGEDVALGLVGPEAFAVENGKVFILDKCNRRVVVWENGVYSGIDISDCLHGQHMTYDRGVIGIVDTATNVTGLYGEEGTRIKLISHLTEFTSEFPMGVAEISGYDLIWKATDDTYYQYNWSSEQMNRLVNYGIQVGYVGNTTVVTEVSTDRQWTLATKIKFIEPLKIVGDYLFYSRFDLDPDAYSFTGTTSVGVIDQNGNGEQLKIESSQWSTNPTHPFYVSGDGKLYLMDCYENQVVISEVILSIEVEPSAMKTEEDITYGEFRSLVEAEITRQAEELMKQKESWFAEYNGEKLLKTDTATFYRADEGETLEQILKCMVDSWYADLPKATATGRSVITDYFLDMESQCIYDADQVNDETIAFVWDWWPGAKEFSGLTAEDVEEYIRMVLPMSFHVDGRPMSDGVWLVPKLEIYIRYDGRMGYFSWEEYVDEYGYEMKNGCMPYYREGISSTFHYILIQEENVYRLQAADAMGYDWELFGNYSEWLKLKKNQ